MKFDGPNNCYDASVRLIGTMKNTATLVHGLVFSTKLNRSIRHAWVEMDGKVWDFSQGRRIIAPISDYYRFGKVRVVNTYSRAEALRLARETGMVEWWSQEQREKINPED